MDRGAIFGEKLMNAFAGINTGIEVPLVFQGDETVCYSLSQVLLPRKSPLVVEKIGRDEPRDRIFENNEAWQYDAQRDGPRPARTIRAARSGPRFGACRFLLLAGYENLAAPLFALPSNAKLKWQFLLLEVLHI
jgi:hypothetical protein